MASKQGSSFYLQSCLQVIQRRPQHLPDLIFRTLTQRILFFSFSLALLPLPLSLPPLSLRLLFRHASFHLGRVGQRIEFGRRQRCNVKTIAVIARKKGQGKNGGGADLLRAQKVATLPENGYGRAALILEFAITTYLTFSLSRSAFTSISTNTIDDARCMHITRTHAQVI